jgi:hypothetical protein
VFTVLDQGMPILVLRIYELAQEIYQQELTILFVDFVALKSQLIQQ